MTAELMYLFDGLLCDFAAPCYELKVYVLPKFICLNSNPQYYSVWR